ncbi:DUF1116 domain-containing protein [Lampropedia puyangensis]|nr:DUF1116 domain-containing protein [Lampropedia puyangensis]
MDLFSITDIASRFDSIAWTGVGLRSELLPTLPATTLLHAGPPLHNAPPHAILNSACQAMVFEGMACSMAEAASLLEAGHVQLAPAQDFGVVTPLAQVVSASMPMARLEGKQTTRLAPFIEAGVPALRFGSTMPDAPARLRMMGLFAQHALAPALAQKPVTMAPIVLAGLTHGQDCHAQTDAANTALTAAVQLDTADQSVLRSYPAFVLPIVMAACSVWLHDSGSDIVAAAGNGLEFGFKRRGFSGWHVVQATPPQGILLPGHTWQNALGAIGDSAVVDFAGLGGQALVFCPDLAKAYAAHLPADLHAQRKAVLDKATGNVRINGMPTHPILVNLAILGQGPDSGLIGRGIYHTPPNLFTV